MDKKEKIKYTPYINMNKSKRKDYPTLFESKENCCGCGLCFITCKSSSICAIKMIIDEEGFKYPQIDLSKCIGCKKCEKACINKITK